MSNYKFILIFGTAVVICTTLIEIESKLAKIDDHLLLLKDEVKFGSVPPIVRQENASTDSGEGNVSSETVADS